DDIDPAWVSTHPASGDFDLNVAHAAAGRTGNDSYESPEPVSSVTQFSTIFSSDDDEDDPTWGPFSDSAASTTTTRTSLPANFEFGDGDDDDDGGFGEFQGSSGNITPSFEDSFDGFNVTSSPNVSRELEAAFDDNMEEPTTPKASARKLSPSSSFESVENPDQEDSWSSVWPPPAPAPTEDSGAAAPDAVADAMTSHIVSR
ncbi:hypothetical protein FRC12_017423, partial [Ceratobasidium sp. 428]